MWSAIVLRTCVSGTTVSPSPLVKEAGAAGAGAGAGTTDEAGWGACGGDTAWGVAGAGTPADGLEGTDAPAASRRCTNSRTSFLEMRPPIPLPVIWDRSTPCSRTSIRTAGVRW